MRIDKRYLILSTDESAPERLLTLSAGGRVLVRLTVRLAGKGGVPMYYDLREYRGRDLALTLEPEAPFEARFTDAPEDAGLFDESFRPLAHFTPARGWMNDPNGLVKLGDTWHMFFQHNPVGTVWGNMHWGHAVSRDLVRWQQLEEALFPDEHGTVFSGSAVLDGENVSGLGKDGKPPVLLFYTAAGDPFTQRLAFSTDGGLTFEKYAPALVENLAEGNRDPKVVYCEELRRWVMALYLTGHEFALFTSKNLLDWSELQRLTLPEDSECPDFYPLECGGERKWVFTAAHDTYLVGVIKDGLFVPQQPARAMHSGMSYAAQTYCIPGSNRRVRMAWNRSHVPVRFFQCAMCTPQEMTLRQDPEGGFVLCCLPAKEFAALRRGGISARDRVTVSARAAEAVLTFPAEGGRSLELAGVKASVESGLLHTDEYAIPLTEKEGMYRLRVISDVHSVEVYEGDGEHTLCVGRALRWKETPFACPGARIEAWPLRSIHESCTR